MFDQSFSMFTEVITSAKQTEEALPEPVAEFESKLEAIHKDTANFQISGFNLEWHPKRGCCTFENNPIVMMWIDTTLARLMASLQAMVGDKRFSLALQSEGRKSVEYDWQVISQFSDFREGFAALARVASVGGWGNWQLVSIDQERQECCFRISNSWEGLYQKSLGVCWGGGMLAGKLAGFCSKLFETNCWAEQTAFIAKGEEFDEFVVRPSKRSIEQEIDKLLASDSATRADMAVALQKLQKEVSDRKQAEVALQQYQEQLEELVLQRTIALTQANEQLQQEIAEREQAQEALLESQIRLKLLNSISTGMKSGMSVEQVIERTLKQVSECFKTLRVAYSTLDEQGTLTVIHAIEPPGMPSLTGLVANLTAAPDYLSALCLHKPVIVEDVAQDKRLAPLAVAMLAGGTRALLDVPLQHSEQLVGLLCFDSPEPRKWSEHEIATLTEIAEYLSIVIKETHAQQERKQAEEALGQSEARFQRLAANVPGMIYQYRLRPDGSASFPYVSPGCRELYELEPLEVQQNVDLVLDRIHPDDRNEVEQSVAISAQTLQPWSCEWRLITPSGQIKWVQGVSRPQKQANGDILWEGVLIDISDRKQTEDALRKSEADFRRLAMRESLLNRLANQIRNSLDLNTIQQTLVDEIRELLQLDRCHIDWYRPELEPPAWEVVTEANATSLPSHVGCYPATKVSPLAKKLLRLEPIRVDSVETLSDRTMRRFLVTLGYTAILALPTQTQTGEVFILICGDCHTPRQWTEDEIELLQAVMDQLAIAITHASLYNKTRTKAQELEQALGELQRTQTQLVQSEKMSSLGQLMAGVAHEINNPVSFIYGNVGHASNYIKDLLHLLELYQATYPQSTVEIQGLAEDIELDFLVEDLPKLLDSMKVGATRIHEMVRSLQTFSHVAQAEHKAVNLHQGLDNTLLILQPRLKSTVGRPPIAVIKDYGNLPLVECYAGQLNQVFMNLLTNAIDAIDEAFKQKTTCPTQEFSTSPEITIKSRVVDSNRVSITIADNGSGIPDEVLPKLFDPFFTTKPVGKGTGLGLAISYQIIEEKHKGSLRCHSALGLGTEFVIEIPIKQHRPHFMR